LIDVEQYRPQEVLLGLPLLSISIHMLKIKFGQVQPELTLSVFCFGVTAVLKEGVLDINLHRGDFLESVLKTIYRCQQPTLYARHVHENLVGV
jgi:hypothetical protein